MNHILLGVLATLIVGLALIGWRAHDLTAQLAVAEASGEQMERALTGLNTELTESLRERERLDRIAAESARRRDEAAARADSARRALERLRRENADLQKYLDSAIPGPVAGWLWLPACRSHASGKAVSAADPNGADPQACEPSQPVNHETGWVWCAGMERALDRCNEDKAALREWVDGM